MNLDFKGTCLIVKDIKKAADFYHDALGLTIKYEFEKFMVFDGFTLCQVDRAFERLFNRLPQEGELLAANNFELYFETDDIEKVHKMCQQKQLNLLQGVCAESWGQRTIYLYDIDGYIIKIGERIGSRVSRPVDTIVPSIHLCWHR